MAAAGQQSDRDIHGLLSSQTVAEMTSCLRQDPLFRWSSLNTGPFLLLLLLEPDMYRN